MPNFKKAKSSNWIESDQFGDFDCLKDESDGGSAIKSRGGRKRGRENNNTLKQTPSKSFSQPQFVDNDRFEAPREVRAPDKTGLWINRHSPSSVDQLAVNNKKIEEVTAWILNSFDNGGFLLLTGPAGSGKTATVTTVCHNLNISVKEWVNPVEQVNYNNESVINDNSSNYSDSLNVGYVSKSKQFRDWLRGVKYSSVNTEGTLRKVILIEDFPSGKLEEIHNILESFSGSKSKIPIIFIISESATSGKTGNVKTMFPPQIVERLSLVTINFNPVTTTNMVKTMTRIATLESRSGDRKFQVPDKATLESLAESVGGDLRAGINALQFSCLNETRDLKAAFESVSMIASSKTTAKSSKKHDKKHMGSSELSKIGGKDQGLVMFHALGKILYSKRDDVTESQHLPKHLEMHSRKVLKSNPDEVIEKSTLSADAFNCFLHQNYPPFYTNIDDVQRLSEYLSISDLFMNEWTTGSKISLTEYGGSVGARAVMFCNTAPNQNLGMRKLNKPDYYNSVRSARQRQYQLQNIFFAQPNTELVTSSLPLIAKIKPQSISHQKMITIADIGTFPGIKFVNIASSGTIDQNEFFDESQAENTVIDNNLQPEDNNHEVIDDEEDLVIEEFDD